MLLSDLVLKKVLEDYHDQGFFLLQECDHFLTLYFKDVKVATFNASVCSIPHIRKECKRYMDELNAVEKEMAGAK
jgi:hypothetical protein